MTNKEKLLAAKLLNIASDEFGNHGCNDMDQSIFEKIGFTEEEKQDLALEYSKWNSNNEDETVSFKRIGDSSWMDFIAYKLKQDAK